MIIITLMTNKNRRFWRTSPQPLHEDQDQDWGPGKRWKWWSNVQLQHLRVRHHDELFRWWQNDSSCGAVQKKQEEEEERVRKEIKEYEQVKREMLANKMKIRARQVQVNNADSAIIFLINHWSVRIVKVVWSVRVVEVQRSQGLKV